MPDTAPAAAPQQQQSPFGQSPATGPTPNKGFEAAAAQRLGMVIKQLEEIIGTAGATSEIGQAALKMLNIGVKMVPPGSVSPASAKNNIEQMAMKNAQNGQQMQALRAGPAAGAGGPPAGGPPGGVPPPQMPKAA